VHQVEITIGFPAAVRAVSLSHTAVHDIDLTIKTALTEAFGGPAVRPWSILRQNGPTVTIVGYSTLDADALRERLSLATPAIRNAVADIASAPVAVRAGQQARFSVRLSPTVHVTGRGEKDAFLVSPPGSIRDQVYADYLTGRLRGAAINMVRMGRFRLEKITRPHRGDKAPASGFASRIVPDAVLEGVLTVDDPAMFAETLAAGVGRQRAYGRGFIRLEPLALDRAA
jgi:CRISPR associated protein